MLDKNGTYDAISLNQRELSVIFFTCVGGWMLLFLQGLTRQRHHSQRLDSPLLGPLPWEPLGRHRVSPEQFPSPRNSLRIQSNPSQAEWNTC